MNIMVSQSHPALDPPTSFGGILRRLGPGLIIAAMIVGSGELVVTTKTGAEAGFWLLWLIILGCVIKVFAQVEFGRYAISTGKATVEAMNEVPGPRLHVSWLLWYWLVMFAVSWGQLGGIVGAVGQSLAMSIPLTGDFNRLLDEQDQWDRQARAAGEHHRQAELEDLRSRNPAVRKAAAQRLRTAIEAELGHPRPAYRTKDDLYWAIVVTAATVVLLVNGRYTMVQNVSALLVGSFTAVTIFCALAVQFQPEWAVRWSDIRDGLSFRLPPVLEGSARSPLATALAAFGIIGVGATELIAYPYWCLEKGYARFTGPRSSLPQWAARANGWLQVMRWDAFISMVIYTFATVAFYVLGAAVLHRQGLNPAGNQLVRTLAEMYVPVFGSWAQGLFLFGAFAVLYSTFFVASASHARVSADAVRVFGLVPGGDGLDWRWVRAFCVMIPLFGLTIYFFFPEPTELIRWSGIMQAIMLPMLGGATVYFRYRRCDPRIAPGRLWDGLLWLSALGLLLAGGWTALTTLFPRLEQWP